MLTRRRLFQSGGAFGAAAVFGRRAIAAPSISPAMAALSTYMSEAGSRAIPAEVSEKAKHHILDTLAAMVSGSELAPGRVAINFARVHPGEKVATVAASSIVCGPIEAAFANAMLAHSDETDDSHAPSQSHPGCSIVPAALAVAEQFAIDGPRFLRAVALGYDVGTRVTMTIGVPGFQSANHLNTHAIAGTFGSAAAAASAAGFNAQQMRWLLDYAAQQASGIKAWERDTDHIEKAFVFAGMPARNGVTAAEIVHAGGTGLDDILSGQDNFLLAYAPQADAARLVEKLGERYEIARTNIKKWTVGSPIQAPLDALENLLKKHPFEAAQVQTVVVRLPTSEAALVNNREMPDICLQYMLAVMLLDKTASFRSAHDKARMSDAAIQRERAKVQLVGDEALERRLPRREAMVEVTLADGTRLSEHIDAVRGTAENPMSREEVVAKSRDLMSPVLGAQKCAGLIERILALENLKSARELRALLQR
ncbi:MAG: MmgE/PrpD family protein [Acidobacteriia bacterium]|nr:MmgE/PrpD family protein [Terriglobia bacterium]